MSVSTGEWQTVQKKKRAKLRSPRPPPCQSICLQEGAINVLKVQRKIMETMDELRMDPFWGAFKGLTLSCLSKSFASTTHPCPVSSDILGSTLTSGGGKEASGLLDHKGTADDRKMGEKNGASGLFAVIRSLELDCVCYGLGSFSSSHSSLYQLALLLLILDLLQIPTQRCFIYDPMFSPEDISILEGYRMNVLPENEEGKRLATRPTLFYLMHCGKALYNNLLWRNWSASSLSNLAVIGNSFQGIKERLPSRILMRDYKCIFDILSVVDEALVPVTPRYQDVFNDTAFHWFPLERLQSLPQDLWDSQLQPNYEDETDLEIILAGR
ncbi:SRR1-like protein [Polypterus senegalus]|uniref:SRR1-like protein n=1 Tax=Polypterus senegalus TaxID=55291 RepID=UPI0019666698|nr:SRR1-like protein [Polypterus senegalus]XP_039627686.1 SRR1-like protein [Polypterus senegalus]